MLVAESCGAQRGKILSRNIWALDDIIANGGPRISVGGLYHSPGPTPAKEEELFRALSLPPSIGAGLAGKLLMLGDFNAPKIDWVRKTAPEDTFGHQLLRFMYEVGVVQSQSDLMDIRTSVFNP